MRHGPVGKILWAILSLVVGVAACVSPEEPPVTRGQSSGMGMDSDSSMWERHHALIPEAYIDVVNPSPGDRDSIERGAVIYAERCAICHGDGGMGDGPASVGLDPAPAPLAQTSWRVGDNYLFYRVSEGGLFAPFSSTMPAWKDILDEQARWDVINYMLSLSSGQAQPGSPVGGAVYDPEVEAANHAAMIAQGVEQGVISQAEGEVFLAVHAEMDVVLAADTGQLRSETGSRRELVIALLLADGRISQEQADIFNEVHDKLTEAGLMD